MTVPDFSRLTRFASEERRPLGMEYTRYMRPLDVSHPDPVRTDAVVELANRLANDRWELVTATPFQHDGLPHVLLTFRRDEGLRRVDRDALQRDTLVEFQETLGQYVRAIGKATHHDRKTLETSGKRTLLPEGLSDELFEEGRRLRQLAMRIRDDDLRDKWATFWSVSTELETTAMPQTSKDIDKYMLERFTPAQKELDDRLGEVLRNYF